jgi:ADP-ribose pyrophosphatase
MILPEIKRIQAVEVYRNGFGALYDDHVVAPDGTPGRYLRWEWNRAGVVVVAYDGSSVALSTNFRYPIAQASLEFPRGFRKPGEGAEDAARRELQEEVGVAATRATQIGDIFPDTGFMNTCVPVVLAAVASREQRGQCSEAMESIAPGLKWLCGEEVDSHIREGRICCGLTLAALGLFRSQTRF